MNESIDQSSTIEAKKRSFASTSKKVTLNQTRKQNRDPSSPSKHAGAKTESQANTGLNSSVVSAKELTVTSKNSAEQRLKNH